MGQVPIASHANFGPAHDRGIQHYIVPCSVYPFFLPRENVNSVDRSTGVLTACDYQAGNFPRNHWPAGKHMVRFFHTVPPLFHARPHLHGRKKHLLSRVMSQERDPVVNEQSLLGLGIVAIHLHLVFHLTCFLVEHRQEERAGSEIRLKYLVLVGYRRVPEPATFQFVLPAQITCIEVDPDNMQFPTAPVQEIPAAAIYHHRRQNLSTRFKNPLWPDRCPHMDVRK